MSEFEKFNQKNVVNKAAMRKETIKSLAKLFAIVWVVVMAFVVLEWIGFISDLFMLLLIFGTVLVGAFNAGRIWNGFKR